MASRLISAISDPRPRYQPSASPRADISVLGLILLILTSKPWYIYYIPQQYHSVLDPQYCSDQPLGSGLSTRPSLIFSCISTSLSLRCCLRTFFLSFLVSMRGTAIGSLGTPEDRGVVGGVDQEKIRLGLVDKPEPKGWSLQYCGSSTEWYCCGM